MSGGTENTRYYVSALVKNDGGIATNTGYKKQALRSNLDQELGNGLPARGQPERHPQRLRPRALQQRQLRHQPVPGVPVHAQLHGPAAHRRAGDSLLPSDFPTNPFERSNPLQTFQFLKNDEDVWRLLGTSTLAVARRSGRPRATCSSSASAGVDYFQQDNNFVSPPELQYEPNDGQPGTVVLSKSSNRNLNLALNATHTYLPGDPDHGTQWTTSAGIQYEERRLFATQILGRDAADRAESPQQAAEPDRALANRAGARPRHLRPGGGAAGRPPAAAHRRRPRRPEQRQRQHRRSSSSTPRSAASYLFEQPVRRRGRAQAPRRPTARPATGRSSAPCSRRTPPARSAGPPARSSAPAPGDANLKPERQKEFEGGLRRHACATGGPQLSLDASTSGTSRDLLLEQTLAPSIGPGEPDLQLRQHGCGTRASRRRSRSSRCRPGT